MPMYTVMEGEDLVFVVELVDDTIPTLDRSIVVTVTPQDGSATGMYWSQLIYEPYSVFCLLSQPLVISHQHP